MDKALHALAGALIFTACDLIGLPERVSLLIVLLAGCIKELSDYASQAGQIEAADILATMLGGLLAYSLTAAYRLRVPN